MDFLQALDGSHLQSESAYLVLVYIGVLISMLLDCATGVRKAMQRGEATTSRGFRRTAEKAAQYFMPMICLTIIDLLASKFLDYPYLTICMGCFNIYIEMRSIWENTHTEEETQKDVKCAEDLIKFITEHKEDIKELIK